MILDLQRLAAALGGDVSGNEVRAPGPNHSARDRSLSVKPDADALGGFLVHSFSGDDPIVCRDYVRKKLALPELMKTANVTKRCTGDAKGWRFIAEYVYRAADGEPFIRVQKYLDESGKKQYPQRHWDGEQWIKGKPDGGKLPYRLPQLLASPLTATIYFCEGEKDADAVAELDFIATTASEGAAAKWDKELTPYFKNRHVVILPDADEPGRKHAQKVAKVLDCVAASVKVVDLFPDNNDGSDVSDWLKDDTAGSKLAKLAKEAPLWEASADAGKDSHGDPAADDNALIAELAALPRLQYAKRRKEAAKRIGITTGELGKIVAEARGVSDDKEPAHALYEHWNVEPADDPLEDGVLLGTLVEAIRQYVFLSEDQAVAVALWICFSWLHEYEDFATHSPILFVTSAEKDSGKSTLLGVVNFLARRSLQSVEISGPALFRSIAKWWPTLIVDEADDAFADNVDLRSVVNSGWTRGQGVVRCHSDTRDPEHFSTFAPKVIGMKGRNLRDTTLSRSIVITMKPRRPNDPKEQTADFSHTDTEAFAHLRSQLKRWAVDSAEGLAKATPQIPPSFHNRRRANWIPLLAIAEAGGDDWKKAGLKAALAIEAVADTFNSSIGVQLLQAIKGALDARGKDRITSAALVSDLVADETGPWATYNRGKPISQRQIASVLKVHDVKPGSIRLDDETTAKGYLRAWLDDAFNRFCPSASTNSPTSIRHGGTSMFSRDFSPLVSGTNHLDVPPRKEEKPFKNNVVPDVPDKKPGLPPEKCAQSSGADQSELCAQDVAPSPGPVLEREAPPRCAQCYAETDGSEQLCSVDGQTVWLHRQCQSTFLEDDYHGNDQVRRPGTDVPDDYRQ